MQLTKSKNYNIFFIKLSKLFLPSLFLFFTVCLLIFSKSNLPAVKNGLDLWINSVVPSLFPFFVATELLMHTNIIHYFELIFKGICSKSECESLLSFTNNSGPLFIIGSVGISMFGSAKIGMLLFITHFLACITVGIIFRFWKHRSKKYTVQQTTTLLLVFQT